MKVIQMRIKRSLCIALASFLVSIWGIPVQASHHEPSVIINEFMAVNSTLTDVRPIPATNIYTRVDNKREYADWIELRNLSSKRIHLRDWSLTDDENNLTKWSFPSGVYIPAGSYLVVYASNKDVEKYGYPFEDDHGHLHTNFELSLPGEFLALVKPDGTTIEHSFADYPPQRGLVTYGVSAQSRHTEGYLAAATPSASNSALYSGMVEDVQFSVLHGFHDTPFALYLQCDTPGVTIRYTTDCSHPTQDHGTVYTQGIVISKTTCVRAAAFKTNLLPSTVKTQTYLFLDDVPGQATHPTNEKQVVPAGYPNRWISGGDNEPGDYQVDPDITDPKGRFGKQYAATFKQDLLSIPSISVVAPIEDLFGPTGIYVNESQDGTERRGSAELLDPNGTTSFTMNCGIRMQGGASEVAGGTTLNRWKCKKLSMRLMFRGLYGGRLRYPLFGSAGTDTYNTIVLDSRPQNSWLHSDSTQRRRGDYVRDQVSSDMQLALGGYACRGRPLHVYINGLYWGMYWMHERPDASFAASYLGGIKEDYDVIKHVYYNAIDGDNSEYLNLFKISSSQPDYVTAWARLQEMLDVNDFMDYMITNYYLGNGDWDHKNWYATYNRFDPNGRWRWHMWDGEHVMGEGERPWFGRPDNTGYRRTSRAPTGLHWDWIRNDEYRMRFADRVYQHFFNNGPLTPENFLALFNNLTDQIDRAIVGESARWGDYRRSTPYTRDNEWMTECQRLRQNYIPGRRDKVLKQFTGEVTQYPKDPPWYPRFDPPQLYVDDVLQYGGTVPADTQLILSSEIRTKIWYTVDGSDPRLPGGDINTTTAQLYSKPISLHLSTRIKARARGAQGQWSALYNATFGVTPVAENLRVTELMYHPESGATEFIELQNTGSEPIELTMVRFTDGVSFNFPSITLEPGDTIVVVEDTAAFSTKYPHFNGVIAGEYTGRLSNKSEAIKLTDATGQVVQQFTYQDTWFPSTDGDGYSLEITDALADLDQWNRQSGWRASSVRGGTPGSH